MSAAFGMSPLNYFFCLLMGTIVAPAYLSQGFKNATRNPTSTAVNMRNANTSPHAFQRFANNGATRNAAYNTHARVKTAANST